MKIVIARSDLLNIIGKIQGIIPSKPSSPILSTVLLEASNGQITVTGTDLSVSIRGSAPATVVEEGAIALPARRFFQLIREITSPQVKINAPTSEMAEITTGTSLFKIHGMDKVEFPHLPDLSGSTRIAFPQGSLKKLLSKTAFAAAREDSRYTLNGVQLQLSDGQATFIGTDGKRLAKVRTPVSVESPIQGSYVISLKAVEEMSKLLGDSESPASLSVLHDKISLENESTSLTAKLLSGQYPDVERVIPSETKITFSIHREELISLLRQISLFTSETSHSVRFSFETGQLHLSCVSTEVGEGRVSMPVDYSGEKLDIAFNPYFLIDILRHSIDETVKFGLIDAHNPGLITDSTGAIFVIMPMRLSEQITPKEAQAAH